MRILALLIVVMVATSARADGYYVTESFGAADYRGDLDAYGEAGLRLQLALGYRRGDWSIEALGGGIADDFFYVDCYGDECHEDPDRGGFFYLGVDIKRRWPVLQSRWRGLGIRFAVHGGPRYFGGTGTLTGYDGPGLNAGATIEADAWLLGYFIDAGVDAMWMSIPVDHMVGTAPYLMFGARVGWL